MSVVPFRQKRTSWFWLDTVRSGTCRGCGGPIVFAENVNTGKLMPFTGSRLIPIDTTMRETKPGKYRQAAEVDLARTHFATCPQARTFRSRDRQ